MRVAVVGLGYWGSKVFEEYCDLREDGRISAVTACDIDATKLPSTPPADATSQSLEDILPDIDAAHICIGNEHHFNVAKRALEADTAVLMEKPLTVGREEAYDLVELASSRGQILQTGHVFRFANVVREVKQRYADGYFGELNQVTLRWTHQIEPLSGTDVLWDLLPHPIDILNYITEDWPSNPTGRTVAYRCSNAETAFVTFDINGAIGNIQVSWIDPVRRRQLELVGSDRTGIVDCVGQSMEVHGEESEEIDVESNNTIRAEVENFVNAIETHENRFNSAIVGARTVDTIETIVERIE